MPLPSGPGLFQYLATVNCDSKPKVVSGQGAELSRDRKGAVPHIRHEVLHYFRLLWGAPAAAWREVCFHRGWLLWAAHVRTNHVPSVVEAEVRPEMVMKAMGAARKYAMALEDEDVQAAIQYVISRQGEPMQVYLRDWP